MCRAELHTEVQNSCSNLWYCTQQKRVQSMSLYFTCTTLTPKRLPCNPNYSILYHHDAVTLSGDDVNWHIFAPGIIQMHCDPQVYQCDEPGLKIHVN